MTAGRPARATPDTWMFPPADGWTYDQVKDLELPFDWELVDGVIVVRGMTRMWHDRVRNQLYHRLESARRPPYAVDVERCVMVEDDTVLKPDVVVYDRTGLDVFTLECTPVSHLALAVEVVSPGSRNEDRFLKPGICATAEVPYYWRVERGEDDTPVVHELWLHRDRGEYIPAPAHPEHQDKLVTDVPFPVEIDLRSLVEL
ncbi:Uma2 family endonuclease [Streptomyces sodiiphilus]|uniref:Uma2 family endonuclease n=1 Tax=Streptomyces sodiiphilus TaxID=226217 RepID=A0ABP5ANP8_9ACTN